MKSYNGLGMGLGNLSRLSHARSRSISPENLSGEKGQGSLATPIINYDTFNIHNHSATITLLDVFKP